MNWRDHIHSDPGILGGKPVFRGTRITVEMVLKLVAAGWTVERMADEYPGVLPHHPAAAAGFAASLIGNESFFAVAEAQAQAA